MVIINIAYTAPINGKDTSPILTSSQVWEGLKRKVLHAEEFVPVITACEVISEETVESGVKIVRDVTLSSKGSGTDGKPVRETVFHHAPVRADFQQPDGSNVSNIVSKGPDGELLMTYAFEWRHPSVEEGSEESAKLDAHHWGVAKMAVDSTIATIRRLVKGGEIHVGFNM
ncbi:hypothetical protein G7046_g2929 [Stylonectria norvegica]|nr:hypothetical protein G7046_g2929 [Stylonectria norvegica]